MALLPRVIFSAAVNYADTTPPTLSSANIPTAGTTMNIVFSEAVYVGSGGSGGFTITMSGGAVTLTYSSGSGSSTLVYSLSRTVDSGETCSDFDYTQPTDGIEDIAGNDLASFTNQHALVTNNSTQGVTATEFVTAFNASGNYDASVVSAQEAGFKFTVGGSSIDVTEVGFQRASGTFGNKTIRIRDNSGTLVASGTAIYTSAAVGSMCWASVGTPVTLSASTIYHITADIGGYNAVRACGTASGHTTTAAATINALTNANQTISEGIFAFVSFKYT